MSGPPPKRTEERRRRNKPADGMAVTKIKPQVDKVKQPAADSTWHKSARRWYKSLAKSAQAQYFEPSDWEYARVVAEMLSRQFKSKKGLGAEMMKNTLTAMNDLLTTEASRRRVRFEIDRSVERAKPSLVALDKYRKAAEESKQAAGD